jgi:adenylosuccinate lyase
MMNFEQYLSPFTWRYGSEQMRHLWSEIHKRRLWRKVWLSLAEVQAEYGIVSSEQVADLGAQEDAVNIARSLAIEAEIHHDLMAELKAYAEQCALGGGAIHLGATSTDITDNADALRIRDSLDLILEKLRVLLSLMARQVDRWADLPLMAFTHLQPAEPSTLGYRLAQYAQDLFEDAKELSVLRGQVRGKGLKGAVGTSATFVELVGSDRVDDFEARVMARLELPYFPVTTQTYPRKQEYRVVSALAGLGATMYKFAFDLRVLQSPAIGELGEPFGELQVGSSTMPFKRNPINAEKIDSLARLLAQFPRVAWDNAAHSLLERTLDDSANRRVLLPEAFLISDELLSTTTKILRGMRVDEAAMERNLGIYGPFAATERLLVMLGKAGADRQQMHELLRKHAMTAWEAISKGQPNPLIGLICLDAEFLRFYNAEELQDFLNVSGYLGNAAHRARAFAQFVNNQLQETK